MIFPHMMWTWLVGLLEKMLLLYTHVLHQIFQVTKQRKLVHKLNLCSLIIPDDTAIIVLTFPSGIICVIDNSRYENKLVSTISKNLLVGL